MSFRKLFGGPDADQIHDVQRLWHYEKIRLTTHRKGYLEELLEYYKWLHTVSFMNRLCQNGQAEMYMEWLKVANEAIDYITKALENGMYLDEISSFGNPYINREEIKIQ